MDNIFTHLTNLQDEGLGSRSTLFGLWQRSILEHQEDLDVQPLMGIAQASTLIYILLMR